MSIHQYQKYTQPQSTPADENASFKARITPRSQHRNGRAYPKASALQQAITGQLPYAGQSLLQLQRAYGNRHVQDVVEDTGRSNPTGIPDHLKAGLEKLSGFSLDDVKVHHNSARAAQYDALAYTQGNHIHIGPGQEKHLAHEVWHVVQQKQGRVKANAQVRGADLNDDPGLEYEADSIAQEVTKANSYSLPQTPQSAHNLSSARPEGTLGESGRSSPDTSGAAVIQRAIKIGKVRLPRTSDMTDEVRKYLSGYDVLDEFERLNNDRERVYTFDSRRHLRRYLQFRKKLRTDIFAPTAEKNVSKSKLTEAHGLAQDIRFSNLYQPAPIQIPSHAPGAHSIAPQMLPPIGTGHHWTRSKEGSAERSRVFEHRFKPHKSTTIRSFGNPKKPSIVTNQGGLTLGMHIQPTSKTYIKPITRSQSTYGHIKLGTVGSGRVRGHPYVLRQNQKSTDPKSSMDMDTDPLTYTDESDSTKAKGGVSSWRSNQIEAESIKRDEPFTQINFNPQKGEMGIAQPEKLYFRRSAPSGGYDDILIDNMYNTDYRNVTLPKGVRKQAHQTEMGRKAAKHDPYPTPRVHAPGDKFKPKHRHKYQDEGYMSPPPSPFLADEVGKSFPASVPGEHFVNERVKHNGKDCIIVEVIAYGNGTTACRLAEVPETSWQPFV